MQMDAHIRQKIRTPAIPSAWLTPRAAATAADTDRDIGWRSGQKDTGEAPKILPPVFSSDRFLLSFSLARFGLIYWILVGSIVLISVNTIQPNLYLRSLSWSLGIPSHWPNSVGGNTLARPNRKSSPNIRGTEGGESTQ